MAGGGRSKICVGHNLVTHGRYSTEWTLLSSEHDRVCVVNQQHGDYDCRCLLTGAGSRDAAAGAAVHVSQKPPSVC